MIKKIKCLFKKSLLLISILILLPSYVLATEDTEKLYEERITFLKSLEMLYQIPWYYLAAIDQFERNIQPIRNDLPEKDGLISLNFSKEKWFGISHPNLENENIPYIPFFCGFATDGNGDNIFDVNNELDVFVSYIDFLLQYGNNENDIFEALTDYYNEESAKIIIEIAKIFKEFNSLDISGRVFPIAKGNNYSYKSTYGAKRGWGGIRIHEGTDIFASYGTTVKSACNGYVEILGWNEYGGWRVGIRGINNIYYYYAHLSSYKQDLAEGDIVKIGDVIGYVGNSGYGPPGTQGKFPPHLHFGLYQYNGKNEWSFDPYPFLRKWEKN